ncbi:MAG: hypothetical protein DMG24_15270 [Acidobacteria bacterium]|nr:MAG: hypothetical protein DMG24_15270 [Acidobacteriota bacterium]
MSATNKELTTEIARQTFREDLYYRLRVVLLKLPPLREHKEDIPLLAEEFCRMLAAKHGRPSPKLSREAMELLAASDWKGNVRELKNVLESAIVMSRDDVLGPADLPSDFGSAGASPATGAALVASGERALPSFLEAGDYREAKRQVEISYIKAKLRQHGGNITRTAAAIGLHRQSLQEKLRELGISAEKE